MTLQSRRRTAHEGTFRQGTETMRKPMSILAAMAAAATLGSAVPAAAETTLTVMSFNIWGGGGNEDKPIDETVAAILAAGADIVAINETRLEGDACTADECPPIGPAVTADIAEALGFHFYDQTAEHEALWANAVISRYPIVRATDDDLGVIIDVDGRRIAVFCIHLDDSPYQPYQLLDIEYGDAPFLKTADEAIAAAEATRGGAIDAVLASVAAIDDVDAVFIAGDFNEPSHRDWTQEAADAGLHPIAVAWPATRKLEAAGFVDLYRAIFPDPVARPAFTWTPTSEPDDPEDHHDRIDFLFARADGLSVDSAAIVGEKAPEAEIVVTPWPSDHRAVVATVRF